MCTYYDIMYYMFCHIAVLLLLVFCDTQYYLKDDEAIVLTEHERAIYRETGPYISGLGTLLEYPLCQCCVFNRYLKQCTKKGMTLLCSHLHLAALGPSTPSWWTAGESTQWPGCSI